MYKTISRVISKLERMPQDHESHVCIVSSAETLDSFVRQVTSSIDFNPLLLDKLTTTLRAFLQSVYDKPNPDGIALLDRRDRPGRPVLDVYVLWSSPIQLPSDAQEMRDIIDDHAAFVRAIHPFHDSLLNIVDPRRYPSPEHLHEALSTRWGESIAPGRVITCAKPQLKT